MSNWILPSLFVFAVIRKSFHDKSINSIQCDFLGRFRIDWHCNQCNVTVRWFYLNFNISLGLGWGLFRVSHISVWAVFGLEPTWTWVFLVKVILRSFWAEAIFGLGHFKLVHVGLGPFRVGPRPSGSIRVGVSPGRDQFGLKNFEEKILDWIRNEMKNAWKE